MTNYIPKDPIWQSQVLDNLETLKAKIAAMRTWASVCEKHTLHYDPQNPYASLDQIYHHMRMMERELDAFYDLFVLAWGEIVNQIRTGAGVDLSKQQTEIIQDKLIFSCREFVTPPANTTTQK